MAFSFRPAVREQVGLIIGLAGGTGAGKSYSAMRLAKGISGDKPFAVIDTEAGRAKHYADRFTFDHGDLKPPFRPQAYTEAIDAADKAGYPVIIVDSVSHEWAGEGGILEWQEEEYKRLGNNDSIKLLSWSAPKQGHKRMVSRLLQSRAHLILCFRAEPHVEMARDEKGKTVVRPKVGFTGYNGWFPVTEKNLPFELTVYFMLMAEKPGYPLPIKLQEQHKTLFPLDQPINEDSGRRIAEWAKGGENNDRRGTTGQRESTRLPDAADAVTGGDASDQHAKVTPEQIAELENMLFDRGMTVSQLSKKVGVESIEQLPATMYERAKTWITAHA